MTKKIRRVAVDGPQGLQSITDDDAPDVYPYVPGRPSVEWVTDRLPNDDEYPIAWWHKDWPDGHMPSVYSYIYPLTQNRRTGRWVSLSVLLDAAGLGER